MTIFEPAVLEHIHSTEQKETGTHLKKYISSYVEFFIVFGMVHDYTIKMLVCLSAII